MDIANSQRGTCHTAMVKAASGFLNFGSVMGNSIRGAVDWADANLYLPADPNDPMTALMQLPLTMPLGLLAAAGSGANAIASRSLGTASRFFSKMKFWKKPTKMTSNQIGKIGEDAVSSAYDIGKKKKIYINGRTRIPDGINSTVLSEVKNVKSLSYTRQLRDFSDIAAQRGLNFDLYTRPSTIFTEPLMDAVNNGAINLKTIPGVM